MHGTIYNFTLSGCLLVPSSRGWREHLDTLQYSSKLLNNDGRRRKILLTCCRSKLARYRDCSSETIKCHVEMKLALQINVYDSFYSTSTLIFSQRKKSYFTLERPCCPETIRIFFLLGKTEAAGNQHIKYHFNQVTDSVLGKVVGALLSKWPFISIAKVVKNGGFWSHQKS